MGAKCASIVLPVREYLLGLTACGASNEDQPIGICHVDGVQARASRQVVASLANYNLIKLVDGKGAELQFTVEPAVGEVDNQADHHPR